jgi:hypothetical protein
MKNHHFNIEYFATSEEMEILRKLGLVESDIGLPLVQILIEFGFVQLVMASGDRITLTDDGDPPILEMFGEWREDL